MTFDPVLDRALKSEILDETGLDALGGLSALFGAPELPPQLQFVLALALGA